VFRYKTSNALVTLAMAENLFWRIIESRQNRHNV